MNSKCNLTRNLFKKILIFLLLILNFGFASAEEYLSAYITGTGKSKNTLLVQTIDGQLFLSKTNKPYDFEKNFGCSIYIDDEGKASLILPNGTSAPATKILENDSTILEFIKQSDKESNENTKKPRITLLSSHEEKTTRKLATTLLVTRSPKAGGEKPSFCPQSKLMKCEHMKKRNLSYENFSPLGTGAMGTVYGTPEKKFVYKVMQRRKIMAEAELKNFRLLKKQMSSFSGDCIEENEDYIILRMKRYQSDSFSSFKEIKAEKAEMIDFLKKIQGFARDILLELKELHNLNIVHLDIKPENILIDKDGKYHIIDFGTAINVGEPTLGGNTEYTNKFTPGYINFGYITNQPKDTWWRADIYAFGLSIINLIYYKTSILDTYDRIYFNYCEWFEWWHKIADTINQCKEQVCAEILKQAPQMEKKVIDILLDFIQKLTSDDPLTAEQALNHQFLNIKF